ncbi:EamA family transporter [bacterium]|nr:MAG: EamA family transporter [bacterium]
MTGLVLALAAAAIYGTGDFLGGVSSKRSSVWAVVVVSQSIGGAGMLAAALLSREQFPSLQAVGTAALGGIAGGAGVVLLYRGLALGRMSIVAPVTGAVAVVLPVLMGIVRGEHAAAAAWLGVALTACAVVLVSAGPGEHLPDGVPCAQRSRLIEAVGAGVAFGLLYVIFARLATAPVLWATVAARSASVPFLVLVALAARGSLRPARASLTTIAWAGICDAAANVFYLLALRHTLLAFAAVITSLYPASTVLLARVVLRERLVRVQWVGVALALAGIVLIAAG